MEPDEAETPAEESNLPPQGTIEWLHYWSEIEGHLPSPINVSITGSTPFKCPELKWYNFDIYPHKIKLTNTGYTLLLSAKWTTERPYLEGGPFLEKHVLSQIHFHWGANMMEGSDHAVDDRRYPGEMHIQAKSTGVPFDVFKGSDGSLKMVLPRLNQIIRTTYIDDFIDGNPSSEYQVSFFRSEYLTQEEALHHHDGVTMICYIIKYGVSPDERLSWVLEGINRVQEAQTNTRIGPLPMSRLLPMFFEDYFLYWGTLETVKDEKYVIKWLVPRTTLFASLEQMNEFRRLWGPWDEPNLRNYRPLQERGGRHVFFINPHWAQYNSLLPISRVPEPSISVLSPAYRKNSWMLPPQNRANDAEGFHFEAGLKSSSSRCLQKTI